MRIVIVAPVRPGSNSGNDVTALRWQRRLTELRHQVQLVGLSPQEGEGFDASRGDVASDADLLVVLHARRCAAAVAASRASRPARPIVVGLAGTDLYADLPADVDARAAIDAADRLVVFQQAAVGRLAAIDPALGAKAQIVHQSTDRPLPDRRPPTADFVVTVLAHLRDVKDPLLAARAARRLPDESSVTVIHAGAAHDDAWAEAARAEQATNPRYRWMGELHRDAALDLLARSTVLACTSKLEGGANVVTEAIALGVPVVGTAIEGNTGLLGGDYPALVPVGDEQALADVLHRLEVDAAALADLCRRIDVLGPLTEPGHERDQWALVLAALDPP